MKTEIKITGQQNSVSILRNACWDGYPREIKLPFGNIILEYKTKKEAVKALSLAYQELKTEKVNYKRGVMLSYDAATAEII